LRFCVPTVDRKGQSSIGIEHIVWKHYEDNLPDMTGKYNCKQWATVGLWD
jgi:hypothetical protein